jgi:hypothetical protein
MDQLRRLKAVNDRRSDVDMHDCTHMTGVADCVTPSSILDMSAIAQHQRRTRILALLGAGTHTKHQLAQRVPGSTRSLQADLRWLADTFPGRVVTGRVGKAKTWRFDGTPPTVLANPIAALDEDQIAALIAARGLLRIPDHQSAHPVEGADTAYAGALAQAPTA